MINNNIKQRAIFCQGALADNKMAAKKLRDMATGLENCNNTSDVIYALQSILYVSERTIFRDLVRNI